MLSFKTLKVRLNSSVHGASVAALMAFGAMVTPAHALYTNYGFADGTPVFNLDIYSTWAFDPAPPNSVFAAYQFWFDGGPGGYIGTQIDTQKKAIFAIWDDQDNSGTAQPISGKGCARFDGEGSGASCLIKYKWVAGHEYRQRVWAIGYEKGAEHWKGTIYDVTTGVETVLGVIAVKDVNGQRGYGWLQPGGVTFIEYYGGGTCGQHALTRVTWRGPFANGGSAKAISASAAYDPHGCTNSNARGLHRPRVVHESGIGIVRTTPDGTQLWKRKGEPDAVDAPTGAE